MTKQEFLGMIDQYGLSKTSRKVIGFMTLLCAVATNLYVAASMPINSISAGIGFAFVAIIVVFAWAAIEYMLLVIGHGIKIFHASRNNPEIMKSIMAYNEEYKRSNDYDHTN